MVGSSRRRFFTLLSVSGLLAGCSATHDVAPTSTHPAISLSTAGPAPLASAALPPEKPCVNPTAAELRQLEADSDVVARATVPAQRSSATPIGTNGEIQYTVGLQGVHILATKASNASPPEITSIVADDNGDPTTRDLKPGAYILFLSEGPSGDYYSTNGMLGEFPINAAQTVARECPHYGDPTHPIAATGTPPNLASFLAEIPPTLPPHAASPLPSAPSS